MSEPNFQNVTWSDIELLTNQIVRDIERSKFDPDVLISIGRGGMVLTRLLADRFNKKNIAILDTTYYTATRRKLDKPKIGAFNHNVYGMNVLLIDDLIDSGGTMQACHKYIADRNAKAVKVAALLYKISDSQEPTFCGRKSDPNTWIVFPWEKTESEGWKNDGT